MPGRPPPHYHHNYRPPIYLSIYTKTGPHITNLHPKHNNISHKVIYLTMTDPCTTLAAISSVGFPIVAYLMIFWLLTRVIHRNTEAIKDLEGTIELLIRK